MGIETVNSSRDVSRMETGCRKPLPRPAPRPSKGQNRSDKIKVLPNPPESAAGEEPGRKLQALLAVLTDWMFIVRKDGVILECRAPLESQLAGAAPRLVGKRAVDLLTPALLEYVAGYWDKTLATGRTHAFACQCQVEGKMRDFQVRTALCGPDQVLVLAHDVTERRLLEKEILEISNREQMRIGQDLHDSLGQHLTGITFLARALENKLAAKTLPEAHEAAEIGKLVLQALSQTRNLARGLFPVELESTGLVQALKDLAITIEKCFHVPCQFAGDGTDVSDRTLAHHLFRITQEAVSNAVRHGKAKQLFIGLHAQDQKLFLTVRDTGVGFPGPDKTFKGLGLRIMQYRAQKIRAALEIGPAEAGGTLVRCICCLPAAAQLAA